jgi:hypothetical protein
MTPRIADDIANVDTRRDRAALAAFARSGCSTFAASARKIGICGLTMWF